MLRQTTLSTMLIRSERSEWLCRHQATKLRQSSSRTVIIINANRTISHPSIEQGECQAAARTAACQCHCGHLLTKFGFEKMVLLSHASVVKPFTVLRDLSDQDCDVKSALSSSIGPKSMSSIGNPFDVLRRSKLSKLVLLNRFVSSPTISGNNCFKTSMSGALVGPNERDCGREPPGSPCPIWR